MIRVVSLKSLVPTLISSALVLLSWFGWSMCTYGWRMTFLSNATVTELSKTSPVGTEVHVSLWESLRTIFTNISFSFIPWPWSLPFQTWMKQGYWLGEIRDYWGLIYQTNLVFACGSAGGVVLVYLLAGNLGHRIRQKSWQSLFLAVGAAACVLFLGAAVHGVSCKAYFGLTHLSYQPVVLMGIAYLAASFFSLPSMLRWILVQGSVIDLLVGIIPQFAAQHLSFPVSQTTGELVVNAPPDQVLNSIAMASMKLKALNDIVFLGDLASGLTSIVCACLVMFALLFVAGLAMLAS